jgi:hypothetical protein
MHLLGLFGRAWQPVRIYISRKLREAIRTLKSGVLHDWSALAEVLRARRVHAEFLSIERKSKADAPHFRSWRTFTRTRAAKREAASSGCRRAFSRHLRDALRTWQWWSSISALARRTGTKHLCREAFFLWYCGWWESKRRMSFFVVYRSRWIQRQVLDAFRWELERATAGKRANSQFEKQNIQVREESTTPPPSVSMKACSEEFHAKTLLDMPPRPHVRFFALTLLCYGKGGGIRGMGHHCGLPPARHEARARGHDRTQHVARCCQPGRACPFIVPLVLGSSGPARHIAESRFNAAPAD